MAASVAYGNHSSRPQPDLLVWKKKETGMRSRPPQALMISGKARRNVAAGAEK
jgi:hypothetical protein